MSLVVAHGGTKLVWWGEMKVEYDDDMLSSGWPTPKIMDYDTWHLIIEQM